MAQSEEMYVEGEAINDTVPLFLDRKMLGTVLCNTLLKKDV